MEELKTFLTNFDFEVSLGKTTYMAPSYNNFSKSFEFIFLWLADQNQSLFSKIKYDDGFFDFIKEKRGFVPSIDGQGFDSLWWGDLSSEEKWNNEREINSKKTSLKCRQELGISLNHSGVLEKGSSLTSIKVPFVLKDFFGFSGKGSTFIRSEEEKKSLSPVREEVLYEPLLKRVRDFGVSYSRNTNRIIQNLIDDKGQFKGALIKEKFPEEKLILSKTLPVFNWYKSNFGVDSLQIDCFQYLEEGELKFNPLCEVNHRRTMGSVAFDLHSEYGGESSAMLFVSGNKVKRASSYFERSEQLSSLDFRGCRGVLPLSSLEASFQVYFLSEQSDRGLQQLIVSWWKLIRKSEDLNLPREFIINT